MAIPVDQDGRVNPDVDDLFWDNADTRVAAGRSIRPVKVIVDIREFGSSLPNILQAKRLALLPITLEVGDYVLSPEICVERKSIADLIGSFKSGRLYNQCQAMSAHYKYPILLIEFEKSRSFTLQSSSSIFERSSSKMNKGGGGGGGAGAGTAPNMDLQSKLTLLTLHFPKLGIIWSQSPQATAEIFEDLKVCVGVEQRR